MGNLRDIKSVAINPDDLMVVTRSEFIPGTNAQVDVFLKLSERNFVMILKEGTKVNFDEMHFPEKAEWLYVRKADYHKCVGRALTVAGIILENDNISIEKKTVVLSKAADAIFKEIEHLGFGHQSLEHSKVVSKSIQNLVESKPDLGSVINMMANLNDELIRHSMMVSAVSVIIARAMKWTMTQNLEKLALGALLHDVGMKELPEEILDMPRHAMTREQLSLYESHVYRGVEILRTMPSISDDIISMALEHHENAAGQGYPRRVRDSKMNPFARVVALADCFSDIVMKSVNNPSPKTAGEAIHFIEVTLGQPFHKPAFAALKAAFEKEK
ncbi:HD domain protein [compost metagenome]